jgi:hypothetical protein
LIPGDFQIKKPTGKQMFLGAMLGIGGLVTAIVVLVGLTWVISAWFGTPVIFGSDEGPEQPVAFPHTTHVQDLGLDCTFCHRQVETSAQATIPAVAICMTCHQAVPGSTEMAQAEIKKVKDAHKNNDAINWVRVHRVPDHVHFVHEAHIKFFSERDGVPASQVCSTCHGDVGSMEKVKQVRTLKMSDCVDCHRDNGAPTDCTTCHY